MSDTIREITELEARLREADFHNDPAFFETYLAENSKFTGHDGQVFTKREMVEAHEPAGFRKFTSFDVSDLVVTEHGEMAIVTCRADLTLPGFQGALRFTRVWLRTVDGWRLVAGHFGPSA